LLATTHHSFPADTVVASNAPPPPRLRIVEPAARGQALAAYTSRRTSSRLPIIAVTVLVHAVIVVALWHARPWAAGPKPPSSIEVALIAPPAPEKPKPPPPPKVVRDRVAAQSSQPSATVAPVTAQPLPVVALVPPSLTPMPVESPIRVIEASVVAAAPPTERIVAPPPVEVVPPRFDASYLDNPAPLYPASAKRAGEEGRVLVRVLVSADGRAQSVEVAQTSGFTRLDAAAIDAVRRWRFVPARRGDATLAAHVNVPIVFSLRR
jgi:protein TonB